jgi:hypothetical protein
MLYYDDRDYFYNSDDIDELYDDEMIFEEDSEEDTYASSWEYDYHNLTNELVDD